LRNSGNDIFIFWGTSDDFSSTYNEDGSVNFIRYMERILLDLWDKTSATGIFEECNNLCRTTRTYLHDFTPLSPILIFASRSGLLPGYRPFLRGERSFITYRSEFLKNKH
jgi:hypothetical protein